MLRPLAVRGAYTVLRGGPYVNHEIHSTMPERNRSLDIVSREESHGEQPPG